MTSPPLPSPRRTGLLAAVLATTILLAGIGGFLAGDRWAARRPSPSAAPAFQLGDWTPVTATNVPRYEFARVLMGDSVLVFGGYTHGIKATSTVEVLHLPTGRWVRRRDMPVALTHAPPVVVRDTAWFAGGFEGDSPGPATARVWRYAMASDAWSPGPPLPDVRGGGALVARGDTLHYLGGWLADRFTDAAEHWALVIGDSVWRPRAPLPTPRGHITAVLHDGRIHVFGGNQWHDPTPVDLAVVERYDPATDRWDQLRAAPLSITHTEPSSDPYAGGLLMAGGRSRDRGLEQRDDLLWYDYATDRWRQLGRMPRPMFGGFAAVQRDTVYVGFGAGRFSRFTDSTLWRMPLRDRWRAADSLPLALGELAGGILGDTMLLMGEKTPHTLGYDLASGRWLPVGTLPVRPAVGHHHAAEVLDGRLYLLGGLGGFSAGVVQMFDPKVGRWALRAPMPFAAGASASAVINGRIIVAGGIVDSATTSQVAIYDPATNRWTGAAPMPRGRNHAASATDGRRLYVFGGRGAGSGDGNVVANGFDDVQVYDPATDRWTVSDGTPGAPAPLPQARGGMGKAVWLDGEFWVIGGETRDGPGATSAGTYARVDIYDPVTNRWRLGPDLPTARHGIFPLADYGRILVAGGGERAGNSQSKRFDVLWPSPRLSGGAR